MTQEKTPSFSILKVLYYTALTIFMFSISFLMQKLALYGLSNGIEIPLLKLTYHTNKGISFSTFENFGFIFSVLALVAVFFIVVYICYNTWRLSYFRVSLFAILTSGIAANMFERVARGYVTDYLTVKYFPFPIFNFQDVLVIFACATLILVYQIEYTRNKNNKTHFLPASLEQIESDKSDEYSNENN